MKNFKRLIAIILSITLFVCCFAGCGKGGASTSGKGTNSKTDIEISYWNAGLDRFWLEGIIDAFNKKYPEYHAYYSASSSAATVNATFGIDGDTIDLYLSNIKYDVSNLEPLDDVLNSTVEGDKKPLIEKFNKGYLDFVKASDGHYYTLTFGGGVLGIVYNKEHFKKAGIKQTPRTTNELSLACDSLNSSGYKPICHFSPTGYWHFLSEALFCQYDGFDYYINNFYACKDKNGNSPSKDVFTQKDGRYQVLKAYEKIITPEYVLEGSNSVDHTTAQTQFLNGKASMMVSGSWLSNEMVSVGGLDKFSMMRTPVISAITDKLTTVKSEGELRKLISAIDSISDGEKKESDYKDGDDYVVEGAKISAADWKYVWTARHTIPANFSGNGAYIPKYSNNVTGAKEFLKFLFSDEGYKIYADILKIPLPLTLSTGEQIDTSEWNVFEKSQLALLLEAEITPDYEIAGKHRIFIDGGAMAFADVNYISSLCAANQGDRKTATQLWDLIQKKVNDNYEKKWLKNIK